MKACNLWLAVIILAGCSTQGPALSKVKPDPLIEQVYRLGEPATKVDLFQQMNQAQVIFLGEHHDNNRHHQIQLEVLQQLVDQGIKPVVAFEAFSQAQTSSLNNYVQAKGKASERSLKRIGAGSKQWEVYRRILSFSKKHSLELAGLDLDPDLMSRLTHRRAAQLTPLEQEALPSAAPSSPAYQEAMFTRFTEGHCGWSNPTLLDGLFRVWQLRNQTMAEGLSSITVKDQVVVVILGSGHIEFGQAVVSKLKKLRPEIQTFSLALIEVGLQPAEPDAYFYSTADETKTFGPAYTWGWFTNRSSWIDPCERFKLQLKTHQTSKQP